MEVPHEVFHPSSLPPPPQRCPSAAWTSRYSSNASVMIRSTYRINARDDEQAGDTPHRHGSIPTQFQLRTVSLDQMLHPAAIALPIQNESRRACLSTMSRQPTASITRTSLWSWSRRWKKYLPLLRQLLLRPVEDIHHHVAHSRPKFWTPLSLGQSNRVERWSATNPVNFLYASFDWNERLEALILRHGNDDPLTSQLDPGEPTSSSDSVEVSNIHWLEGLWPKLPPLESQIAVLAPGIRERSNARVVHQSTSIAIHTSHLFTSS